MEREEVVIPADGGLLGTPAYVSIPDSPARGVVVIHEAFGRQPEIDRVVDHFASKGYAAAAPDLFAHGVKLVCIRRFLRDIAAGGGESFERVRQTRDWLQAHTGLSAQRIGIIGFCMGGGFALAAGGGFGAVSANYGDVPQKLPDDLPPVIACYGGRDPMFGRLGEKLEPRLEALGVEHEVYTYPEAGHSFLTDGNHPVARALSWPILRVGYEPKSAKDAWRRIEAFFQRHLA